MERSFEVSEYSFNKIMKKDYNGRYIANNHRSAALKAATQLFRLHNKKTGSLTIVMRETTRNSKNTLKKYKISRKMDERIVNVNGKNIKFSYQMSIQSV
jgi:hypothetical protein